MNPNYDPSLSAAVGRLIQRTAAPRQVGGPDAKYPSPGPAIQQGDNPGLRRNYITDADRAKMAAVLAKEFPISTLPIWQVEDDMVEKIQFPVPDLAYTNRQVFMNMLFASMTRAPFSPVRTQQTYVGAPLTYTMAPPNTTDDLVVAGYSVEVSLSQNINPGEISFYASGVLEDNSPYALGASNNVADFAMRRSAQRASITVMPHQLINGKPYPALLRFRGNGVVATTTPANAPAESIVVTVTQAPTNADVTVTILAMEHTLYARFIALALGA